MPYSTSDDLLTLIPEARLIELTDDEGAGTVDATKVADAIAAADGEINGYLAERYDVPLDTVPDLIKNLSRDIAIYNLYSRTQDEVPKVRQSRYEAAMKALRGLADGSISLGVADPPDETNAGAVQVSGADRIFDSDSLEDF